MKRKLLVVIALLALCNACDYLHKGRKKLMLEDMLRYADLWIDVNENNVGDFRTSPDGGMSMGPSDDEIWKR